MFQQKSISRSYDIVGKASMICMSVKCERSSGGSDKNQLKKVYTSYCHPWMTNRELNL